MLVEVVVYEEGVVYEKGLVYIVTNWPIKRGRGLNREFKNERDLICCIQQEQSRVSNMHAKAQLTHLSFETSLLFA